MYSNIQCNCRLTFTNLSTTTKNVELQTLFMHATTQAFLYVSCFIVYIKNRANGEPKPTTGYGTDV